MAKMTAAEAREKLRAAVAAYTKRKTARDPSLVYDDLASALGKDAELREAIRVLQADYLRRAIRGMAAGVYKTG